MVWRVIEHFNFFSAQKISLGRIEDCSDFFQSHGSSLKLKYFSIYMSENNKFVKIKITMKKKLLCIPYFFLKFVEKI